MRYCYEYLANVLSIIKVGSLFHLVIHCCKQFLHCSIVMNGSIVKAGNMKVCSKATQQINFTVNLDRAGNTRFCFILEEAKETVFEFSQGVVIIL